MTRRKETGNKRAIAWQPQGRAGLRGGRRHTRGGRSGRQVRCVRPIRQVSRGSACLTSLGGSAASRPGGASGRPKLCLRVFVGHACGQISVRQRINRHWPLRGHDYCTHYTSFADSISACRHRRPTPVRRRRYLRRQQGDGGSEHL